MNALPDCEQHAPVQGQGQARGQDQTQGKARALPALFSIHDVMPETLERTGALIARMRHAGLPPPALLVVPGRAWNRDGVARLRAWQDEGAELVAHGWRHETRPRGLYHRLHALLISRQVAEHLAQDQAGVRALMRRSRDWFGEQGLTPPTTYVPPAWALGLPAGQLLDLPFSCVETLSGVYLKRERRPGDDLGRHFAQHFSHDLSHHRLPLLGFEADTRWRARFLRFWNAWQRRAAERRGRPLRIGIHPQDAELRLSDELDRVLSGCWTPLAYTALPAFL